MQLNSESGPLEGLTSHLKLVLLETWFRGASTVLTAWLATLHKDRFIARQPGTTALPQDWNGMVLAY